MSRIARRFRSLSLETTISSSCTTTTERIAVSIIIFQFNNKKDFKAYQIGLVLLANHLYLLEAGKTNKKHSLPNKFL